MENFSRAQGARHALAFLGLYKFAAEPSFGGAMDESIVSSTGDEGRTRHRTSEDPRDQVNTGFLEHDRHLLRDPANSSYVLPVGLGQSMNTKNAAARKLQGRRQFRNLEISIENRKGGVRTWYDSHSGKSGHTRMKWPYGYIRMSKGMDGDHVDCFIGPNEEARFVYIVLTRRAPDFKLEDEQKCMLGFNSAEEAKKVFLHHYNDKRFFKSMRIMPYEEFEKKVLATLHGTTKKVASPEWLEGYARHSALNLGQAVHDVSNFSNHPWADKMGPEGSTKHLVASAIARVPSLASNMYYMALPPQLHHSPSEMKDLAKKSPKEWFREGYLDKTSSNVDDSDEYRTPTGPTHNSVPGDFLGHAQSSLVGMRSIKGDGMEPEDKIDRMFRFHDEPTSTRVLDGNSAASPASPAV